MTGRCLCHPLPLDSNAQRAITRATDAVTKSYAKTRSLKQRALGTLVVPAWGEPDKFALMAEAFDSGRGLGVEIMLTEWSEEAESIALDRAGAQALRDWLDDWLGEQLAKERGVCVTCGELQEHWRHGFGTFSDHPDGHPFQESASLDAQKGV